MPEKSVFRFKPEERERIVSALRLADPDLLSSLEDILFSAKDSADTMTPLAVGVSELEEHLIYLRDLYTEGCKEYESITGEPFDMKMSYLYNLRDRFKNHEHPHCKEFVAVFDFANKYHPKNSKVRAVELHSYFYALVRHLTRLHHRIETYSKVPEQFQRYAPLTFVKDYKSVPTIRNSFVMAGDQFDSKAVRFLEDFPVSSESSIQVKFNPSGFVLWLLSHFSTLPFLQEVGTYLQAHNFTAQKTLGVSFGKEVFAALVSGNLSEADVLAAEEKFDRPFADFSVSMFLDALLNANPSSSTPNFTELLRKYKLQNSSQGYLDLLNVARYSLIVNMRSIYNAYNLEDTALGSKLYSTLEGFRQVNLTHEDLETALQGVDLDVSSSSFDSVDMHLCFKSMITLCGELSKRKVLGDSLKFTHVDTYLTPHFHLPVDLFSSQSKEDICESVHTMYLDLLSDPSLSVEKRNFLSFYLPEVVFPGESSAITKRRNEARLKRMRIRYRSFDDDVILPKE